MQKIEHILCRGLNGGRPDKAEWVSKNINFEVSAGEILAIMGPSGAGKSTLINAMLGHLPKRQGEVFVNGVRQEGLHNFKSRVGLVPQDDILVNELTVKENIRYFHTIAIDSELSGSRLDARITEDLVKLGIQQAADKRIGNVSGGQRKRANIAMELINDPEVLIIDEPTSGLSSHDSLSLMRQLRAIADEGRIVIIIIHQPSSEIFSLFDRLLMLDAQGHCIRSGPRDEVLNWFEQMVGFRGKVACGQQGESLYLPERLMDALESRPSWARESGEFQTYFANHHTPPEAKPVKAEPFLRSPMESLKDFYTLVYRQARIKWRDPFGRLFNLVVPIVLGILIALVFRSSGGDSYHFEDNLQYGSFVFLLMICGIFIALISSVLEVIKDEGILNREAKRGLSMLAYYASELFTLCAFGVVQATLLVVPSLLLIGAIDYLLPTLVPIYMVMVVSFILGLLVSSLFTTPIAAYNLVPLLVVPQILFGGALMPYKDMGDWLYWPGGKEEVKVPWIAQAIPARWGYEMVMTASHHYRAEHPDIPGNVVIEQLAGIGIDGFLALERTQTPWLDREYRTPERMARTEARDAQALLTMAILLGLMGMYYLSKRYAVSGTRNTQVYALISFAFPILLLINYQVPAPEKTATAKASKPDFQITPQPLSWHKAWQFCENDGQELASFERTLNILRTQQATVPPSRFWTAEMAGPEAKNKLYWQIDAKALSRIPVCIRSTADFTAPMEGIRALPPTANRAHAICVKKKS